MQARNKNINFIQISPLIANFFIFKLHQQSCINCMRNLITKNTIIKLIKIKKIKESN